MPGMIDGSETFVRAVQAYLRGELGLPRVGTPVGRGPHVDMSAALAWVANPVGPPPPGVSAEAVEAEQSESDPSLWGAWIPAELEGLIIGRVFAGVTVSSFKSRAPTWARNSGAP